MNKFEKFAVEHSLILKGIRRCWKAAILRHIKLQNIAAAIHREIDPIIEEKKAIEDFFNNGYKSQIPYRDPTISNAGYIRFYTVLMGRENQPFDLSAENEPILETVKVIKQLRKEQKEEEKENEID